MMAGKGERMIASAKAERIMLDFGHLTGLDGQASQSRRYLWTDAFAVCCYLELFCQRGNELYRELGLRLVEQVHHTLGRHRPDDPRQGWISGLDNEEGSAIPPSEDCASERAKTSAAQPSPSMIAWNGTGMGSTTII